MGFFVDECEQRGSLCFCNDGFPCCSMLAARRCWPKLPISPIPQSNHPNPRHHKHFSLTPTNTLKNDVFKIFSKGFLPLCGSRINLLPLLDRPLNIVDCPYL